MVHRRTVAVDVVERGDVLFQEIQRLAQDIWTQPSVDRTNSSANPRWLSSGPVDTFQDYTVHRFEGTFES